MSTETLPAKRLSPRLTIVLFAIVSGVLALGYFLFLRPDYEPVFAQVRPAEASAIVAQLDTKSIPFRLADGGTTVLVPADQANAARLAIAGSDVALKGGVGFELFNKSDMGLTDFAQRINYQRALQGELERSIMMIGEVETARVHLAMPERTIFRSERSNTKAAVELVAKPGARFEPARVAGIQRLVAFAVPNLSAADVVVLDGNGHVLSQRAEEGGEAFLSPDAEEQRGLQGYYRARARTALAQTLPGVEADVKVLALGAAADAADASSAAKAEDATTKPGRNFRLRVIVATAAPLNAEDTALARTAVVKALALDEAAGDELTFQVGLPGEAPPSVTETQPRAVPAPDATPVISPSTPIAWSYWLVAMMLVIAIGALLWSRVRGGSPRLTAGEREAMLGRIRAALRDTEGSHASA